MLNSQFLEPNLIRFLARSPGLIAHPHLLIPKRQPKQRPRTIERIPSSGSLLNLQTSQSQPYRLLEPLHVIKHHNYIVKLSHTLNRILSVRPLNYQEGPFKVKKRRLVLAPFHVDWADTGEGWHGVNCVLAFDALSYFETLLVTFKGLLIIGSE